MLKNKLPAVEQANPFPEAIPETSGTVGKEYCKYANA